ncbi:MAG: pentapeptide repeat-containing protein [Pseudonocardiaceae bacterium]
MWPVALISVAAASAMAWVIYLKLRAVAAPRPGPNGGPASIDSLDVIKTTITVAGFIGAVLVGVYGYRKQRLIEGDAHRADAGQLAQRYTTAADQLGHEKAAVRLAGVYAMARLADDWGDQRQVCIDVLCAYLRMPYEPDTASEKHREGERHVRLTVQEVLFNNLRRKDVVEERQPWPNIDLNLRGAHLDGVDLSSGQVRSLDMTGCHLFGQSNFDGLRVTRNASFGGTLFKEDAAFHDAIFVGVASFSGAKFEKKAVFIKVSFLGDADFATADFSGDCWFRGSTFHNNTVFSEAEFRGMADLIDASFLDDGMVLFDNIQWLGPTYFTNSYFKGVLHIINCEFADKCTFSKVQFRDSARFDRSKFFGETYFNKAEFNDAWFPDTQFTKKAHFEGVRVKSQALFAGCEFETHLILNKSRFDVTLDLSNSRLFGQFQTEDATFAAGANLNGALISGVALNTVNNLWPSQWEATLDPHKKDGLSFQLNLMSPARSIEGGT